MVHGLSKISWFKDNYAISNNRYSTISEDGGVQKLIIRDPVLRDAGFFKCRAEENKQFDEISILITEDSPCMRQHKLDKNSSVLPNNNHIDRSMRSVSTACDKSYSRKSDAFTSEEPLYRDAKRKPIFTTTLMDRTAAENSSIKLICQIIGVDTHINWYRNSILLDANPRYIFRHKDGLATLEIFSVRPEDSGEYTCEAKNCYGDTMCSSFLKVFAGYEARPMPPIFTRSMKGRLIFFQLR